MRETEGIVIKSDDFRETSLIVSLYTREFGSLKVLAKGARDPKRNMTSCFVPVTWNYFSFYPEREKGLYLLGKCETKEFFPSIKEDITKFSLSLYMLEIAETLSPEKNPELFQFLIKVLEFLEVTPLKDEELFLSFIEYKILYFGGFRPSWERCVGCHKPSPGVRYSFQWGGILCSECQEKDPDSIPFSESLGRVLQFLSRCRIEDLPRLSLPLPLKKSLKGLLHYHLFHRLEGKPRTLPFLEEVMGSSFSP